MVLQNIRLLYKKVFKILNRLKRKCDKPIQMFSVTPAREQLNFFQEIYILIGIKNPFFAVDFKNSNMP
jgi:hypothetical protein